MQSSANVSVYLRVVTCGIECEILKSSEIDEQLTMRQMMVIRGLLFYFLISSFHVHGYGQGRVNKFEY